MSSKDSSASGCWHSDASGDERSKNEENQKEIPGTKRDASPSKSLYQITCDQLLSTVEEADVATGISQTSFRTLGRRYKVSTPYVVFVGDAGTGKSTIVEKLTGEKNRSLNCSESFTKPSEAFSVPDGSLIVSDTPGSNPRKDRAEMNKCIAEALKYRKVSKIFIVSKAQLRIDSVIDNLRKYADNFVELPSEVIGVVVTHMDLVEWKEEILKSAINDELGIVTVIFSGSTTTAETLLPKIVGACKAVDCENVEKLFKLPNNQGKIQEFINDEVTKFSMIKKAYDKKKKSCQDRGLEDDLAFETLAYMSDEIDDAKKRMTNLLERMTLKWDSYDDSKALKDGLVVHMVNQLKPVLVKMRNECEDGMSEFRKCPYCGFVSTKKGSSSEITCGDADLTASDTKGEKETVFSTFSFAWENDELIIQKKPRSGCGKKINWEDMAPVKPPDSSRKPLLPSSLLDCIPRRK